MFSNPLKLEPRFFRVLFLLGIGFDEQRWGGYVGYEAENLAVLNAVFGTNDYLAGNIVFDQSYVADTLSKSYSLELLSSALEFLESLYFVAYFFYCLEEYLRLTLFGRAE